MRAFFTNDFALTYVHLLPVLAAGVCVRFFGAEVSRMHAKLRTMLPTDHAPPRRTSRTQHVTHARTHAHTHARTDIESCSVPCCGCVDVDVDVDARER